MVARLLARSSWQFYRSHPAQLLLSIIGIVLGVGIVTAVLITNSSSQRAFALSTDALYGRTTHHLQGANGVSQKIYQQLRLQMPEVAMAPVVEGYVSIGDNVFSVIGLDPFVEFPFARIAGANQRLPIDLLLQNGLLISRVTQDRLSLPINEPTAVETGGRARQVRLLGSFDTPNAAASEGLLLGDIAIVQPLLDRGDKLDRIDLILNEAQAREIASAIPATLRLTDAAARHRTMQAMTRGFQINLTAMSLLALLVGAFLIHNTMTFSVLQRRELFAIKRITGMTARAILGNILIEALSISTLASLLGVALGYALAHALIQLTTQTINDLYFVLHVQKVWFSPALLVGGLLLGVGTSVLAASLAAWDAASTSPVQARMRSLTEQRTLRALPRLALAGLLVAMLGVALAVWPLQSLTLGFAALMLLIVGYGLTLPWCINSIARLLQRPCSALGFNFTLALGGIERNISRTGLAISALTIAVSATFGVDIMIGSFRSSVDNWLSQTLQSDIYVSAPSTVSSRADGALHPSVRKIAASISGVADVSTGRTVSASTSVGTIDMLVLQAGGHSKGGFEMIAGEPDTAWNKFLENDELLISEPLANKHALRPGDALTLFTERHGDQAFEVAGVFRDYGSSHGKLAMSRATFEKHWADSSISSLGIALTDASPVDSVLAELREALAAVNQPLLIRSNKAIHDTSLAVFDRTFEVTRVLRWLTVGVAFVGIFSALQALHLERAREFAVLRATGGTRRQVMAVVSAQTLLMGLFAGILALPLGWLMSEVLIKVINVRSFGWSMQSLLPSGSIAATLWLACSSALLAGIYPAWRLSRTHIAAQLRDE